MTITNIGIGYKLPDSRGSPAPVYYVGINGAQENNLLNNLHRDNRKNACLAKLMADLIKAIEKSRISGEELQFYEIKRPLPKKDRTHIETTITNTVRGQRITFEPASHPDKLHLVDRMAPNESTLRYAA